MRKRFSKGTILDILLEGETREVLLQEIRSSRYHLYDSYLLAAPIPEG